MKSVIAIFLTFALLVLCCGCSGDDDNKISGDGEKEEQTTTKTATDESAVKKFENLAQNGDYKAAAECYYSDIDGNSNLEREVRTYLNNWVDEIANNLCDENGIVNNDYKSQLDTLLRISDKLGYGFVSDVERLETLAQGVDYFNNGKYAEAIQCLDEVEDFGKASVVADKAEDALVSSVIESAKGYVSEQKFSDAFTVIDAALDVLGSNRDLSACRTECEDTYRDYAIDAAQAASAENKYGEALTILDTALSLLENDAALLTQKTVCEEQQADYILHTTPVDLTTLNPFESAFMCEDTKEKDIFGVTYETALNLGAGTYRPSTDPYATYRIDGVYKTFTGTIFLTTSVYYDSARKVTIYGDGVALYEAVIACGDDSIPFTVDITGVRDLKVIVQSSDCSTYIGNPILTP